MEQEQQHTEVTEPKIKQSDILRKKAQAIETAAELVSIAFCVFILFFLCNMGTGKHMERMLSTLLECVIIAAPTIYLFIKFTSARSESYRTQADILDVLTDIRDGKKKQEETKTE